MKSPILALLLLSIASVHAAEATRPNVVVILADDMGLDSVSAFNNRMGMQTPAIDQLAREGMSFTDAHSTSAVCSPTRYSVLTGRYNWRSRLKRGIVGKWERPLIEDERLTFVIFTCDNGTSPKANFAQLDAAGVRLNANWQLTADFRRLVEQGRSTPGPPQPNHAGAQWWAGLPWPKP